MIFLMYSKDLFHPLMLPGPAMLKDMLRTVKGCVNIPVIGAGELADVEVVADMVEKGEVDFIALGRPIMNHPNFVEELLKKIQNKH
ncbi:hypothetical protein GOM49_05105 [Clostridium bovifaecis]|uniref:NADH:flavin oxidoreductase/NADH oxidase N-terminal domain-containing protein n=1 Tax=Clostridium bovifaecis TaxID=2184719 RepID=A0A6I6F1B3_9CLOT|nr:hypothetical protein GOM49_05105 [Clostridium bovifaecis]